jgi:hypothetical protein
MKKLLFLAGAAVGYLFGTKAGRQRYEQMRTKAREVMDQPRVREATDAIQTRANRLYNQGVQKLKEEPGTTSPRPTAMAPNGGEPATFEQLTTP